MCLVEWSALSVIAHGCVHIDHGLGNGVLCGMLCDITDDEMNTNGLQDMSEGACVYV